VFADEDFWKDQLKERMKRGVNFTTSVQETLDKIRDFEKAKLTGKSVLTEKKKKVRLPMSQPDDGAGTPGGTAKKPVIAAKYVVTHWQAICFNLNLLLKWSRLAGLEEFAAAFVAGE
jgi:hypothetical protein